MLSAGNWRISVSGRKRRSTSHIASRRSLAIISTLAFLDVNTSTIARVNFPVPAAISRSFVGSLPREVNTPTRQSRNLRILLCNLAFLSRTEIHQSNIHEYIHAHRYWSPWRSPCWKCAVGGVVCRAAFGTLATISSPPDQPPPSCPHIKALPPL